MKSSKITLIVVAALGLSACGSQNIVSRGNTASAGLLVADVAQGPLVLPSYTVTDVNVSAPASLTVSEANSYFPKADIVWREDMPGNRHAQISTIMNDAIVSGVSSFNGSREVIVNIEITRFHSLTQRTRASIGGTHDIDFDITILDAVTGAIVEPARHLETSFPALGGREALDSELIGQTQKVRIIDHIGQFIRSDLSTSRYVPAV